MKIFLPIIDNGMQLVHADYAYSLALAVSALAQKHELCVARISYPYPDGAMNYATHMFLESGCERMVIIDGDLSFSPWHVELLLSHNLPIVAGLYPKKIAGILEFPLLPLPKYKADTGDATVDKQINEALENPLESPENLVPVAAVARGFMAIKREVFDVLVANKKGEPFTGQDGNQIREFWKTQRGGHSEDFHFCEQWRELGGSIWIDKRITTNHHGSVKFPI